MWAVGAFLPRLNTNKPFREVMHEDEHKRAEKAAKCSGKQSYGGFKEMELKGNSWPESKNRAGMGGELWMLDLRIYSRELRDTQFGGLTDDTWEEGICQGFGLLTRALPSLRVSEIRESEAKS